MSAAIYNFTLEQGTTFSKTLVLRDVFGNLIDLTDWTGRGQIRKQYNSALPTASFAVTVTGLGTVVIELTDEQTSAISAGAVYVYDIELENGVSGKVMRLMKGKIKISPEVTRG